MSAKEVRFVGLVGLGAVAVFLVAFLVDPTPPTAGASSNDVLRHIATKSGSDRTAAFLFALSGAGLLVLTAGLRQWLSDISPAPRWWGTAMMAGAILTGGMLVMVSALWFTLASHDFSGGFTGYVAADQPSAVATTLSDAINYGFVFAGFGLLVLIGSATAIMLATYGPLQQLGWVGFAVTLLQVPYLLTSFYTSGPMQAGGVITIIGFLGTGLWVTLVSITLLWFARLAAAAARA